MPARTNAGDRRSLEDLRAFLDRGGDQADSRAIGIEGGGVCLDGADRFDTSITAHGCGGEPARFDARGAARVVFAAQRLGIGPSRGDGQQILPRRVAADAEAPERRRKLQRRPPEGLPHEARGAQPMERRMCGERGLGLLANQSGAAGRRPGADASASISTTGTRAAATLHAVAAPVSPPPTMTTLASR